MKWIVERRDSVTPTVRRRKPWLTDNVALGRLFRKKFVDGFRRLVQSGELRLEGEWAFLGDPQALDPSLDLSLDPVSESDWNVFIEGPPHGKSDPVHVLKYLARYMTGGPISDRRIISDEDDCVTFWARSKDKKNQSRPFSLSGKEFVRRWTMHILPKGYTRTRRYGGYHGVLRKDYLEQCRESLAIPVSAPEEEAATAAGSPRCIRCDMEMECIASSPRPSWRWVFERGIYEDRAIYAPILHTRMAGIAPSAHVP